MHPNTAAVAAALASCRGRRTGPGTGGGGSAPRRRPRRRWAATIGAIANSLIFMADGNPVLILTSGAHRVDTAVGGTTARRRPLRRATPEQVRAATGQPIGGVAPVGHPHPVRTWWTWRCSRTRSSGRPAGPRTPYSRPRTRSCCGSAPRRTGRGHDPPTRSAWRQETVRRTREWIRRTGSVVVPVRRRGRPPRRACAAGAGCRPGSTPGRAARASSGPGRGCGAGCRPEVRIRMPRQPGRM